MHQQALPTPTHLQRSSVESLRCWEQHFVDCCWSMSSYKCTAWSRQGCWRRWPQCARCYWRYQPCTAKSFFQHLWKSRGFVYILRLVIIHVTKTLKIEHIFKLNVHLNTSYYPGLLLCTYSSTYPAKQTLNQPMTAEEQTRWFVIDPCQYLLLLDTFLKTVLSIPQSTDTKEKYKQRQSEFTKARRQNF